MTLELPFTPEQRHNYLAHHYGGVQYIFPDLFQPDAVIRLQDGREINLATSFPLIFEGPINWDTFGEDRPERSVRIAAKGIAKSAMHLLSEGLNTAEIVEVLEKAISDYYVAPLSDAEIVHYETVINDATAQIQSLYDQGVSSHDPWGGKEASPEQIELRALQIAVREAEVILHQNKSATQFDKVMRDIYIPEMLAELQGKAEIFVRDYNLLSDFLNSEGAVATGVAISHVTDDMQRGSSMDQQPTILRTAYEKNRFAIEHPVSETGVGVRQGNYAVVFSDDPQGKEVLATDFLMDCVALVLIAEGPNGEKIGVLGHMDAATNNATEIEKMLSEIPEGFSIKASILGSAINDNIYMNTEIAFHLLNSGRINSLYVDTHDPSTVALHIPTGTILTHNGPESEGTSYSISASEIPYGIEFPNKVEGGVYGTILYDQLDRMRPEGEPYITKRELGRSYHSHKAPIGMNSPKATFDQLTADGDLSADDIEIILSEFREKLGGNPYISIDGNNKDGRITIASEDHDITLSLPDHGLTHSIPTDTGAAPGK